MSSSTKLFLAAAGSIIIAWYFPNQSASAAYAIAPMICALLLLSVVFLRALNRQADLKNTIAVELNKIRRVYHLGKNLGENPKHRGWFTELHGYVYGYLSAFDKKSLAQYEETNGQFRKLSYHLYTIDDLSTDKERVLYRDLLEAAGTVAGARQRVVELWNGGLSAEIWVLLFGVSFLAAAATIATSANGSHLASGLSVAVVAVSYLLVRDADKMKTLDGKKLAKRYIENMARLELKRHDEAHG